MTVQQGFLWLAELSMWFALGSFLRAFSLRKKDLARHRFWGQTGAYTVFGGLIAVEVCTRALQWDFPVRFQVALQWHIAIASISLVLLIALLLTGLFRVRRIHIRLYLFFLPAYAVTVILSLFAFRLW